MMETKLEIAIIQANTPTGKEGRFFWLLSRHQLEFILKDVKVFQSPALGAAAQYKETVLPVISLEEHFGMVVEAAQRTLKYLVVRAATDEKTVARLIVATPHGVRIDKLESGFGVASDQMVPRNDGDLLGRYSLPAGGVGLVPDVSSITRSLKWRSGAV
jgi:hypothetical protein